MQACAYVRRPVAVARAGAGVAWVGGGAGRSSSSEEEENPPQNPHLKDRRTPLLLKMKNIISDYNGVATIFMHKIEG